MKKISVLLFTVVLFASCKKFLDINTSPNNPTSVPPSAILPSTSVAMGFLNTSALGQVASLLVQYVAGVQNQPAQYDVFTIDGLLGNQWNFEIYGQSVSDLRILIDQNSATNPAYSGVAKIQLAYIMSVATDLFGEVPYSEAGQGIKFRNPRFDKQEDIYMGNSALGIEGLFDLVKSGIADLSKPTVLKPGATDDVIYKGDLTKWIRAGNTMLLKLAMQASNRVPDFSKTTIQSVITGNQFINTNALDLEVPFSSSVNNQNGLFVYNNSTRPGDQLLSTRLLTLSKSLNDTVRLAKFFTKPNGISFVSYENGTTAVAPAQATRSKYNVYLTGTTGEAPVRLLTNFQVQFILAESALILGTTGDPQTYYQAGIKANMQKIGMTTAEIDKYFADNPTVVTLSGTIEEKRKQIITQKYLAWVGNGIEAYNDYRRTRYPVLALPLNPSGDNPNVIPERFPIPSSEIAANPNAPNPRPKTDVKVWWAK